MTQQKIKNPIKTVYRADRQGLNIENPGTFIQGWFEKDSFFSLINFCINNDIPRYCKPPYSQFHLSMLRTPKTVNFKTESYCKPITVKASDISLNANPRGDKMWQLRLDLKSEILSQRITYLRFKAGMADHRDILSKKGMDMSHLHVTLSYAVDEVWLRQFAVKDVKFKQDLTIVGEKVFAMGGAKVDPERRMNHYNAEVANLKRRGYF
jgi:hypothetical protein